MDQSSQNKPSKSGRAGQPQSVTEVLGKVLEPVLARKTGMKLDLVRAWPELVGEEYASVTRAEKIDWPRRKNEDDPFQPGVLVVACEPAAALFFQHEHAAIVERINVFFGFTAIQRVRILQKAVATVSAPKPEVEKDLTHEQRARLNELVSRVDDPKLREVLENLGKGIMSDRNE